MKTYLIIFRVIGSDVYEMPTYGKSYRGAKQRALNILGFKSGQVIFCQTV